MSERRRVLVSFLALLASMVAINVAATVFYHSTGGLGLLDLGGGANLFDGRPAYTPAGAHALLAGYGPAGRTHHTVLLLTADLAFPAIVAWFGTLALRHAARLAGLPPAGRRWLVLLPLAYLVSDYTENGLELVLLHRFPTEPAGLVNAVGAVTGVKTAVAAALLGVIVVGYLLGYLRGRVRRGAIGPDVARVVRRTP